MLASFTVSALTVTALVSAVSLWGARQAGIAATQTFVATDVTADILPPPMYLIELRLMLSQGVEGTFPLEKVKAEVKRLELEYQAHVKFWSDNPPYGLEAKLLGPQHEAGVAFIAAAAKVVDALDANADPTTLQAALISAHEAYLAHRGGVDATVKGSTAFAETSIAAFDSMTRATTHKELILLGLAALGLAGFGVWIRRAVWAVVGGEPAVAAELARSIAQVDLAVHVPG